MGVFGKNGMIWVDFRNSFLQFLYPALQLLIFIHRLSQDGVEVPICFIEVLISRTKSLHTRAILLDHHTLHTLQVIQEGHLWTPALIRLTTTPLPVRLTTHRKHHPST